MNKNFWNKMILIVLAFCMAFAVMPVSFAVEEGSADVTEDTQTEQETETTKMKENSNEMEVDEEFIVEKPIVGPAAAPVIPPYTGTADSPHLIRNKYELASIGSDEFGQVYPLDGNYKQVEDITFTKEDFEPGGDFYNDGKGWKPITTFIGTYDGGNKKIENIYVNRPNAQAAIFIGSTDGVYKNISSVNSNFFGIQAAGITTAGRVVENCYNSSTVKSEGTNSIAAGIVIWVGNSTSYSRLAKCKNEGEIIGDNALGIAYLTYGSVSKCKNYGAIRADSLACGIINSHNGEISSECFNFGEITSGFTASGIFNSGGTLTSQCFNVGDVTAEYISIGINNGGYQTLTDCFNFGKIRATRSDGMAAGVSYLSGTMKNCYNRGQITGNRYTGGVIHNMNNMSDIKSVYNSGIVNGNGAIAGVNNLARHSYCFYDLETSGQRYAYGTSTTGGLSTSEMTGQNSLDNMDGLNDDDAFTPYENGYPELKCFAESDDKEVRYWSRRSVHVIGDFVDPNEPEPSDTETLTLNDTVTGIGNNQIEYTGNWFHQTQSGNYMDDEHVTNTPDSSFQVRFNGNGIKWYGAFALDRGVAAVYIDDQFIQYVNCYDPTYQPGALLFDSGTIDTSQHTLKVVLIPFKHIEAIENYITIDKIEIESVK